MAGIGEEVVDAGFLDLLARIHHDHPLRGLRDDAEVMGDQDQPGAELLLQLEDQRENLRLDGDVERVVGSSAIRSAGRQASAIAIIARWRMPPESWCGYSRARRSGSGMRTSRSISTACAAACFALMFWCSLTASVIWSPIRMTGLSEVIGS